MKTKLKLFGIAALLLCSNAQALRTSNPSDLPFKNGLKPDYNWVTEKDTLIGDKKIVYKVQCLDKDNNDNLVVNFKGLPSRDRVSIESIYQGRPESSFVTNGINPFYFIQYNIVDWHTLPTYMVTFKKSTKTTKQAFLASFMCGNGFTKYTRPWVSVIKISK